MLVLILNYCFTEKRDGKKNTVMLTYPSSLKIVLILLAEVVAIYVQVFIIEFRELSFKGLFAKTRPVILF